MYGNGDRGWPLLLTMWPMEQSMGITWKLVRNAEAQISTHTYWIRIGIFNTIPRRSVCLRSNDIYDFGKTGVWYYKQKWIHKNPRKYEMEVHTACWELPWRIPGHYFKALLGTFAHDKPTSVYPCFSGLIITKGLVSCGSWVLRPGVDKL